MFTQHFLAFAVNAHRSVGVTDMRHPAAATELPTLEVSARGACGAGGPLGGRGRR